jgi:RsiW-degrading membrane proteinase PrsW (M82 family)
MLWRSALVLALVMIGLGTAVSFLNAERHDPVARLESEWSEMNSELEFGLTPEQYETFTRSINKALAEVLSNAQSFFAKLDDLQRVGGYAEGFYGIVFPSAKDVPALSAEEYTVADTFFRAGSASGVKKLVAVQEIAELASAAEPLPYANYARAILLEPFNSEAAVAAYKREAELFDLDAARQRVVRVYLGQGKFDRVQQLQSDPEYAPFITPLARRQIALEHMDWPVLILTLIPAAYERVDLGMVALALVTGLIWSRILLRFNGPFSVRSRPVQLAVPALVLGALSAHATILFIFWQEHQLGLSEPPDMIGQLLYCMSIGLREEGLKLLLFLPLVPFLWRRSSLEILTVAGLVGLGFAVEENINYFEKSVGVSAVGRFVTANFLHASLTAMGGLALARACIHREGMQLLQTFETSVSVHGRYDAFLMVDVFDEFSWLAMALFVFLGHQYFGWLRYLRESWKDPVSITFIVTLGLVFVAGLSSAICAWQVGAGLAFKAVASEVIGVGVILILFYREIPETLGE